MREKMLHYLQNGFYNSDNYEISLKTYFIYVFSFIALIICLIMGINSRFEHSSLLSDILLLGSVLLSFNMLYLKLTNNVVVSAYIILYFLFSLMLYLVYSGGISHTGPLWAFILPPVTFFIHGLKRGLIELLLFMLLVTAMFFIQDGALLDTSYTHEFRVRLVLIFSVVIMLSGVSQYTREGSMKRMHKLQQDLEFFLKRDPLTGLYNRRGYDLSISRIEESSYGAILMCDIDYFKKINDTYGHEAGDYVLQSVAKTIRENVRVKDISVRWGGEEFLIFLSQVTLSEAYFIAEKLRKNIEHTPIHYDDIYIDVTMSIGIAILEKDIPLNDAIKSADEAMYLSKMNGRNKTTAP